MTLDLLRFLLAWLTAHLAALLDHGHGRHTTGVDRVPVTAFVAWWPPASPIGRHRAAERPAAGADDTYAAELVDLGLGDTQYWPADATFGDLDQTDELVLVGVHLDGVITWP